ncbi:MAG: type II toxin-antitoxin system RelB/DinJ family antitoxin [Turicibacter sp.]|nr:type II toxin-antitoxin system RelB/DinJ family antitoxin [Turicibacter sp.]
MARKKEKRVATTNLTVRVDEEVRKEFDKFCANVGLTATTAVNMFIRTVVRMRTVPFIVTDTDDKHIVTKFENVEAQSQERGI